ncbi:MAG: response regulator [Candidatus Hodarchaeales archaeon]|jgi:two-component system chemotaxis response regulator CheY
MASVIIVDDDPDIVTLFEEFISLKGHTILGKASNGEEAIEVVKKCEKLPDIIFMDHRMPQMTGLEASKIILEMFPSCNIIFISADLNVKNLALEIGAQAFLVKPISFQKIMTLLDKI